MLSSVSSHVEVERDPLDANSESLKEKHDIEEQVEKLSKHKNKWKGGDGKVWYIRHHMCT